MSTFAELDAINQSTPTSFDTLDARMAFMSDGQRVERSQDAKLMVRFYSKQVKNEAKSLEQNRAVYEEKTFINIKIPGDKNNDVNRIAFPEDFQRFPIHYDHFQKGREQVVGTPINALPFLNETQVEEYKAIHIRTVEQLAGMADVQCQKFMGSIDHKQKAQQWLAAFNGADALRAEIEQLKKIIAEKADNPTPQVVRK